MKGVPFLKRLIFSSWFLAAVPTLVAIMFLPPLGSRYNLQLKSSDKFLAGMVYEDLNSDSVSEVVSQGKGLPYYHILILNNVFRVYDQWNLTDNFNTYFSDFFFGNFDNDRYKEIYIFTYKNDSLFLNANEYFDPEGTRFSHRFITRISVINGEITSNVYPAGFYDENGDGFKELYFSVQTGFGLEPRLLYYYDIHNDSLKSSRFTGTICVRPAIVDSDGDSRPEIFGFMSASGNYNSKIPFSDKSTWLMVFDDKLNFDFPPVEIPGFTNTLETYDYTNGSFKGYLVSHNTGTTDSTVIKPGIMLYSNKGKLIRYHPDSYYGLDSKAKLVVMKTKGPDRIYLLGSEFLELNDSLEVINKVKSSYNSNFNVFKEDIDLDGYKEMLLYSEEESRLALYHNDLRLVAETKAKVSMDKIKFSQKISKDNEPELFMSSTENGYFIKVVKNRFYYLGFLEYPGIYGLFILFIILVQKINTFQVVEKENLKRRLTSLQLKGIKAQLDPHFTFNTLNSVASLIYLEDRQAAYDYMNKFTILLRGMLNDAERIYRSVGEEIEFVTTYLELEKLRFGDRLNFRIEVGAGVNQREQIPKLVLHTFAENAVKHGIIPVTDGGTLLIKVEQEGEYLRLIVEDNGVGREKSAGKSTSTGKGLKLTGEFYEILNQINKKPIKHTITDLYNENGIGCGTRVEVLVPLGLG
jgi:two-component sensor histidine kinase